MRVNAPDRWPSAAELRSWRTRCQHIFDGAHFGKCVALLLRAARGSCKGYESFVPQQPQVRRAGLSALLTFVQNVENGRFVE